MSSFTENLSLFFDEAHFALPATIGSTTVSALLDESPREVNGIAGYCPTLTYQTADYSNGADPAPGTAVIADGRTWRVVIARPDGLGITTLDLEYVSG